MAEKADQTKGNIELISYMITSTESQREKNLKEVKREYKNQKSRDEKS